MGSHDFLGSLLLIPTKHEPLSESIVAGAPNLAIACLRTATAFSEVASLKSSAPVAHLDASSRNVIRWRPRVRGSFMTCQSVYHIELGCFRS